MRHSASVALVLTLVAAGTISCSSSSSTQGPGPASPEAATATAHSEGETVQMTTQGNRIFGPQMELTRDGKGIRGFGPLGVVDLRQERDKGTISGVIGAGTTNLHVEPTSESSFNLRGLYAGALGDLEVREDRIQGQLGRCQFDLREAETDEGKAYNGQRWCGRSRQATTLTLSPQIADLAPIDRGALIAILLGR